MNLSKRNSSMVIIFSPLQAATYHPRATENIEAIIELVKKQEGASEVYSYSTSINVSGERITEMVVVLDAMVSGQRVKATMKITFTQYGATSVNVPQEVIDINSKY